MSKGSTLFSIPNLLCFFRLAVIPVIAVLFYFDGPVTVWFNVVLFGLAGISDFLDGYIARAMKQTTVFGKFLDASTDKMLVGAVLVMLIAFDRIDGIWTVMAMLIYLREILIAGVREFMALYNVVVPISLMGKWKLTMQVVSMGFLVAGYEGEKLVPYSFEIGKGLFVIATFLTVASGWDYVKKAWETVSRLDLDNAH